MDGMRWDLWEYIKENLIGSMAHQLRIIDEGALWAHLPSTTPRQMELLDRGMGKTDIKIWKIGGIDERVHTEKGSLEYLFRNILQFLQLDLAPRLRELPSGTSLLFFSDHGFIENPHFEKSDKYRTVPLHPRRRFPLRDHRPLGHHQTDLVPDKTSFHREAPHPKAGPAMHSRRLRYFRSHSNQRISVDKATKIAPTLHSSESP